LRCAAFEQTADDGVAIDPTALKALMWRTGLSVSSEELATMLAEADTDGDSMISFEKFARIIAARLCT